jgi:putative ABC transport system permease protein
VKYIALIFAGLWRKPVRTVLTVFSVALAFLLFGVLRGVTSGLDHVIDGLSANRMRVQSRAGFSQPLPMSYFAQIQKIDGVEHLGYVTVFNSYYRDPKNAITAVAQGGEVLESKPPEFKLPADEASTFYKTRTGAVVGAKLASQYGWKIGDSVSLTSPDWAKRDGSSVWTFDIVGIWDVEGQHETSQEFYFHYDYLDQERAVGKGTVSLYIFNTAHPAELAVAIDQNFANSANPTLTQSDREWVRSRMKQAGDLNLLVNAIVGASLFTLLFLTGNTMMQSVRERSGELAVLKTIGFSDEKVLALVLSEAFAICLGGALLGLAAAFALFVPFSSMMQAPITMPFKVVLAGMLAAAGTAVISSLVPCLRAKDISIVDALAGR